VKTIRKAIQILQQQKAGSDRQGISPGRLNRIQTNGQQATKQHGSQQTGHPDKCLCISVVVSLTPATIH
jgi:hypothetical protein